MAAKSRSSISVAMEIIASISGLGQFFPEDVLANHVHAVRLSEPFKGASDITVNRIAETEVDGLRVSRLVVTFYSKSFDVAEAMGQRAIDFVRDSDLVDIGDGDEVELAKMEADMTGWDPERKLFLRQIEFEMSF